jgi:hypothetical protein
MSMETERAVETWTQAFFDEENIVNSFQHLLHDTAQSVDDLCRLCLAACQDNIVLAMNLTGLMPFANNPEFVFPFSAMNQRQLQALRHDSKMLPDAMACEYDVDVYVLKIRQDNFEIDHPLLVFAAAVILYKGLGQTKIMARGTCFSKLDANPDLLAHHVNAILFQIVHSCTVRRGAVRAAAQLLVKHQVGT